MQHTVNEIKRELAAIIPKNISWDYISSQGDLKLIEISTKQRFIVDINSKKIHNTCAREDGTVSFEGTVHVFGEETPINIYVAKYVGVQLTQRIMQILNLNTADGWYVIDQVESLCLIHFEDEADMSLVGHLRGTLVDVDAGLKIAESFGYTPTVKVGLQLVPNPHEDIELYDANGKLHTFTKDKMVLKRAFEGTGLRIVYYKGEVFKLTHKKIRPMKSRWGNSEFFTNLYKKNGGATDAQLFDLSKKYSPWCYSFMIVDPSLLMVTKQNVKHGYVVFLNLCQMWDVNNCPFDQSDVEIEPSAKFDATGDLGGMVTEPCISIPTNLTLQAANNHLANGYYAPIQTKDIKSKLGEAVMIYQMDEHGRVLDIMKINSASYDYRLGLRGNDSYPYHHFFTLAEDSYKSLQYFPNYKKFTDKYVVYDNYPKEFLIDAKEKVGTLSLELAKVTLVGQKNDLMSPEQKKDNNFLLHMIWLNYIAALPVSMQDEAFEYEERYIKDRQELITWLEHKVANEYDVAVLSKRANQIITTAKMNSVQAKNNGKDHDNTVYNFIHNEFGDSLYSLVKEMKNIKRKNNKQQ